MAGVAGMLRQGILHHQAGELERAAGCYREVLRADPGHGDALHLLGITEHQSGRHENGVNYIRRAIEQQPRSAVYHSNLAAASAAAGALHDAVAALRSAVEFDPQFLNAWFNLGTLCTRLKLFDEAEAAFRTALRLDPRHLETLNNLGLLLQRLKRHEEAESVLRRTLEISPQFVSALDNLGVLLQDVERFDEAVRLHRRGLELQPDFATGWKNLGNAHRLRDELDEAETCYRKSLSLKADDVDCLSNLGVVLKDLGRTGEALQVLNRALELDNGHVEAHVNRAFVRALLGRFDESWDEAEWRWKVEPLPVAHSVSPAPRWNGEPLLGKSILVTVEQGIGDEIFFAECLRDLAIAATSGAEAGRVVVECDPRLLPLYRRSIPGIEFAPSHQTDVARNFDYQIPLGSLRQFFRRAISSCPGRPYYLRAEADQIAAWRLRHQQAAAMKNGALMVGVSWRGGKRADLARQRSTRLEQWRAIGGVSRVLFVNLQYGDVTDEISQARRASAIEIEHWPESNPLLDLDQFAAQISALDLVISIDNTTVHMAGALGVPVWTMLPFSADYRWLLERNDSPWYPSMRLYRQAQRHDWTEVISRVARDLAEEVSRR